MKIWTRTICKIKLQTTNVNYDLETPKGICVSELIKNLINLIHDEETLQKVANAVSEKHQRLQKANHD